MSKLTAKLSDGTEYEVLCQSLTVGGGVQHLTVVPLKPEPPTEMWINIYPNVLCSVAYSGYKEAAENVNKNMGGRTICYVRRTSVLDGKYPIPKLDPEQKPREWWGVGRFFYGDCDRLNIFPNERDARNWLSSQPAMKTGAFEVLRVREVEE